MLKKLCLITSILFSTTSYAEFCPSISDIQSNNFKGWQALNKDSASPAATNDINNFKKNVSSFALAEWMLNAPEGEDHCYYNGGEDKAMLNIYLVKHGLTPKQGGWKKTTSDISQCKSAIQNCSFEITN